MAKIKNKKTGVIKEPRTEIEVSMYLGTNEWELIPEKKASKLINSTASENKN